MNSDYQKDVATPDRFSSCSLPKRCAAMAYDFILLACVLFIAWLPMPLVSEYLDPLIDRVVRSAYLLAVCFLYFAWPWCRGGQTLGMRSWKIRLINTEDPSRAITLKQAWSRFLVSILSWAALGIGFIISAFHPNRLAWHDVWSRTRIVRLAGVAQSPGPDHPQDDNP